ncbi:hypothetical protein IJ750_05910 [bacterium]|nr:hypothetical protein [bacterium]
MQVNNIQTIKNNFKGPLDSPITSALRTFDKNPMVNAVGIDLVAMVGPRTFVDAKKRNKYAAAETFTREFMSTLTTCLVANYIARGIAHTANKTINPKHQINPKSWFSNDSLEFLQEANKNAKNINEYVKNVVNTLPNDFQYKELIEEKDWKNFKWQNEKYKDIEKRIVDKDTLIKELTNIIEDKSLTKSDRKKLSFILDLRTTNLIGKDSVNLKLNDKKLSASTVNLMRDIIDMGRDIFSKSPEEQKILIEKIIKTNKIKNLGAVAITSVLGLISQRINRKITEKRTGTKGFVGDVDYNKQVEKKSSNKDNSTSFLLKRIGASLGIVIMALGVMKVKSPKDFIKKLELTGPVTSGNAIKTVYASTLVGRFMASDNSTELRESVTRDYLGFLNWLVLGGFAAKGAANLMDLKRKNLFHETKKGKGIKHWLYDVSLKSHNEIAVEGKNFAKKNMWKLNLAHAAGLAYSTIALGILLPMLNIWVTKRKAQNNAA